ncbi:MAG: YfiR family protein [Nitrosomonas sp. PRO4]|nr:YfiR family protein [Nitrosomonas sp. PRO4]
MALLNITRQMIVFHSVSIDLNSICLSTRLRFAKIRHFIIGLIIAIASTLGSASLASAQPIASEQTLTAAFLYNFLKFTEWPDDAFDNEVTICTSIKPEFEELDAILGRIAQNKPVGIKRITNQQSLNSCQLLFLPREEGMQHVHEWLSAAADKPILTVSNVNDFLDAGGMIQLNNDGKNLSFSINLEYARRAGLKFSAQLLQIARQVRGR